MISGERAIQTITRDLDTRFFPWAIKSLTISNDEELKNSSDLLGIGKRIEKDLEAARKADKQPWLDGGKTVDDEYKPIQNKVQFAVIRIDQAVLDYHRKKKAEADALLKMQAAELAAKQRAAEEERNLQIAENAARQHAAELVQIEQMKANVAQAEECQQTGEVFEPVALTPIPEPIALTPIPEPEELIVQPVRQTIRGNMSSTSIIDGYDYEIIDPEAVPRDCCSPDLKKCKAKHTYDGKPIPGVLITPRSHTSTRGLR